MDLLKSLTKRANSILEKVLTKLGDGGCPCPVIYIGHPPKTWQRALFEGVWYGYGNYYAPLFIRLSNKKSILICHFPLLSDRETFICDGKEYVYVPKLYTSDQKEREDKTRNLRFYGFKDSYESLLDILKNKLKRLPIISEETVFLIGGHSILFDYIRGKYKGFNCYLLDSTNPLSEVSHQRKFVFQGRGVKGRDSHPTHYGRLCIIETPESEDIGFALHLAKYAVPRDGEILTPLKDISTCRINNIPPKIDSNEYIIDKITSNKHGKVLARGGNDCELIDVSQAKYQDSHIDQLFGLAALQIPFIHHNDPARCIIAVKELKQALPLIEPEIPLIQTGAEEEVAKLSRRVIYAEESGKIKKVSSTEIIIRYDSGKKVTYHLIPKLPVLGKTDFSQKPCIKKGQEIEKGQPLINASGIINGKLALGINVLVAYMPYYGYNFEDGVVISESLANKLKSIHLERLTFLLKEKETFKKLVKEGQVVREGDEILEITQKKSSISKKKCPFGIEGEVVHTLIKADSIEIWIESKKGTELGDKLAGRHGNKGVVTKIVPDKEMPYFLDEKGEVDSKNSPNYHNENAPHTHVEMLLNPHGIPSRMNIGQLLETHMGWVAKYHPKDNIRQKAKQMGAPFADVNLDELSKWLKESGLDEYGKIKLRIYDSKNNKSLEVKHPVVVGYQYIMKLNQLASEKISYTSAFIPRDRVTLQPVRGRKIHGGQRIGEMETWALIAHQAWDILAEFLGEKSDARVLGRSRSIPETLCALIFYLRALYISLEFLDASKQPISPTKFHETPYLNIKGYRLRTIDPLKKTDFNKWGCKIVKGESGLKQFENILRKKKRPKTMGVIEFSGKILVEALTGTKNNRKILQPFYIKYLPVLPAIYWTPPLEIEEEGIKHKIRSLREIYKKILNNYNNKLKSTYLKRTLNEYFRILEHIIKSKRAKGFIREHILSKRINHSARAVIVPDPQIPIGKAGIPKKIMKSLKIQQQEEPIILNRQPTLHKYSLQAFKAIFIEENVIKINPLVCAGFNADFDGDQMAIYLPFKKPSETMFSDKLLLSTHGDLNLHLSQDIVSGVYYATNSDEGRREFFKIINDNEIINGLDTRPIDKESLKKIIKNYLIKDGIKMPSSLVEKIALFGFEKATLAGITFSIFDLKDLSLSREEREMENFGEDHIKKIEEKLWEKASETLKSKFNPVALMFVSGAKGNKSQLRQMIGVKGFVKRIDGKQINFPIISNYLEGLTPTEYFIASFGGRKKLTDRKIAISDMGKRFRDLIYSTSHLKITGDACNTTKGIYLSVEESLGRVLLENVYDSNGSIIARSEEIINEKCMEKIRQYKEEILVRSPLYCDKKEGICPKCFGWDPSQREFPKKGFPVGIVAAQAIGERNSQKVIDGEANSKDINKKFPSKYIPQKKEKERLLAMKKLYDGEIDSRYLEVYLRTLTKKGKYEKPPLADAAYRAPLLKLRKFANENKIIFDNDFKDWRDMLFIGGPKVSPLKEEPGYEHGDFPEQDKFIDKEEFEYLVHDEMLSLKEEIPIEEPELDKTKEYFLSTQLKPYIVGIITDSEGYSSIIGFLQVPLKTKQDKLKEVFSIAEIIVEKCFNRQGELIGKIKREEIATLLENKGIKKVPSLSNISRIVQKLFFWNMSTCKLMPAARSLGRGRPRV